MAETPQHPGATAGGDDGPRQPEPVGPPSDTGEGRLDEHTDSSRRGRSYWFLAIVTIVSLVLDLGTKEWAKNYFDSVTRGKPHQLVLIDGFLQLIYAKNRGGAWGLLQNETDSLRRPFFLIVSVIAIVFIVSLYRKLAPGQTALKWGLPLVLGGALGNLVDRIRYGFVVDFIDVYVSWGGDIKHWPTFNVADIAICIGVALMAIDMFTSRKPKRDAATASTSGASVSPAGPDEPSAGGPGAPSGVVEPPVHRAGSAAAAGFGGSEPPGGSTPGDAQDPPLPERTRPEEPPAEPA